MMQRNLAPYPAPPMGDKGLAFGMGVALRCLLGRVKRPDPMRFTDRALSGQPDRTPSHNKGGNNDAQVWSGYPDRRGGCVRPILDSWSGGQGVHTLTLDTLAAVC